MKITSIRDLAFFVLDIAFLAAMTWLCSSTLIEKWQIEQREKTDGCVISSRDNVRVSHRKGRRREHHSYSCTFSYEVGGHRYTAHDSISGYVTPFGFELPRKGQPITVFYDSENPQSAKVFNPEIHFLYWIGYIALFAGLWLFWPLRFQRKEMCGKSSDRCVEDSSGACKLWMGKYWRNANAPIWPCVLMIIVGLGFTWITLDTGLAYCKSSSIVGCICLALNFASNLAIYLALSCLMSKINPIQRRHRFLAVSGAIISCIILFILWSVFRAAWKDIFGIRGKSLLWPLLFYIEGCRGLWRWIVGVRDSRMKRDGVAVPIDKLREVDDGVSASKNRNRIAICGVLIAVVALLMGFGGWWWQRRQSQTNTLEFVRLCEVGKWDDAFALSQKADRKNPDFQFYIGQMYANGWGVAKGAAEAVRWYRKAANQDVAEAQYNLGVCYDKGEGVAKDAAEAVSWYRKAAYREVAEAQYNLGVCYDKGEGVEKDAAKALRWYRKAAEQGSARAQCNLGGMYIMGRGVEKDTAEAVRWYRKAAEQGHVGAQYNLGVCYYNGEGVVKDAAEAARWYRKAAEKGHVGGQCGLGLCYATGEGVANDAEEAALWLRKAADQGDKKAQEALGYLNDEK